MSHSPPDHPLFDVIDDRPRVEYARWLLRLVCWDGLLPAIVLTAPMIGRRLLADTPLLIDIFGIGLPVAAFCIRIAVGFSYISRNRFGPAMRSAQRAALGLAALLLVMVDCIAVLTQFVPAARPFGLLHLIVLTCVGATYLALMAFALYPGRTRISSQEELLGQLP
ncbi:MAG: hypothetical protein WD066_03785 [Planctomycetaceae bacterium]